MKGDFSKKFADDNKNYAGVLHQQGRVLLDADWNAQTEINNRWQDTAAQDAFGPGVAAVPADNPHAFEVTGIARNDNGADVTLAKGRIWVDGILLNLELEEDDKTFSATYLQRPDATSTPTTDEENVREAVVLEVWRETVSGFQDEQAGLIEPALGGPDTTERLATFMALRLLRLQPGETCANVRRLLADTPDDNGTLTVSLNDTSSFSGDCPVVDSGGYTGFEHHLFRIEIAEVDNSSPMFKWSRFNGGLVGRGDFEEGGNRTAEIEITANKQAIVNSGQSDEFYLEVVEWRDELGHWIITYGAEVTRNGNKLTTTVSHFSAGYLPSGNVFFRLWDGIKPISEFSNPALLTDGINLQFSESESFRPGDYWTFSVRAGLENESVLLSNATPEGIQYHRAALAEIRWDGNSPEIQDCRHIFRPLTNQKVCCSYTVGKGGDFEKIQEAIDKLKLWGGEICLLPGIHRANVLIVDKINIKIKGCGLRTLVIPDSPGDNTDVAPVFRIINSRQIVIENLLLVNLANTVIETQGGGWNEIKNNTIFAVTRAIDISAGFHINIDSNSILMFERRKSDVAIISSANNINIERNEIVFIPPDTATEVFRGGEDADNDWSYDCFKLYRLYQNEQQLGQYLAEFLQLDFTGLLYINPVGISGGIQINSGSEKVNIIGNSIQGGGGNGITLGSTLDALPISDSETEEAVTIFSRDKKIIGVVTINGKPAIDEEILLLFKNKKKNEMLSAIVSNGGFLVNSKEGEYTARVSSANFLIKTITNSKEDPGSEGFSGNITGAAIIDLQRKDTEFTDNIFLPIKEIIIQGNVISDMGLSGIGTPQQNLLPDPSSEISSAFPIIHSLARPFGVLSGIVNNLIIEGNRISRCLHADSDEVSALLKIRGEGGVSLGFCENVIIRKNKIESNGNDHKQPVAGIFISTATQADIHHNHIENNGPIKANSEDDPADLKPGFRGGLIIGLATSFATNSVHKKGSILNKSVTRSAPERSMIQQRIGSSLGIIAGRVHDNVIKQPVGQALRIISLGPLSVIGNTLEVDVTNDPTKYASALRQLIEGLAGAVCLLNVGKAPYRRNIGVFGIASLLYPNGNIIFNNNQTRLGWARKVAISQFMASWDDIDFSHNQSDVLYIADDGFFVNSVVIAPTVRVIGNRLKEPIYNR